MRLAQLTMLLMPLSLPAPLTLFKSADAVGAAPDSGKARNLCFKHAADAAGADGTSGTA